ncbi:folate-binding protein YgfZ [Sphingorhabdus sp. Alg239-R122]|uniref:CAF17-like 4Fe-4S cluster assembly/insertion protein YgfZ n=1 Tax=Sphingorhabdus sp. Alg239-R122 TaxID=2305989 RepID=UPI0013D9A539|nr:folate-binding protein YgfZ [Sphingorhabdus sp. Alg239-R122]
MTNTTLIHRALIRISPMDAPDGTREDIRAFLQGLVTQDMTAVQPGAPQWAALLSAQGKALFDFILWADGTDDILIDCEREAAGDLAKRLTLYRLRRKIAIGREETLCVHWSPDSEQGTNDPRLPALGKRWLAPENPDDTDETDTAWKAHRLSLGVTEGQAELGSDKTLWLECNAAELNGVSFTKGCYVGQENTARMNYRQKVNRRIVVVPLDQAEEKRQRTAYADLGLSVEHRRVDDLGGLALPDWLSNAISNGNTAAGA